MNLTPRVWRQNGLEDKGIIHEYQMKGISEEPPLLEMFDILNEELFARGKEPITFGFDCCEGICDQRGVVINGIARDSRVTTTRQLYMRSSSDGDVIMIGSWRALGFPIIKDLVVNRSTLDHIIRAGGYISTNTGAAPNVHVTPVPKQDADRAFEAAACINCGTCAAAYPNASATLFTPVRVTHLGLLPQDKLENYKRVVNMLSQIDEEGFGSCSNIGECAKVYPKQISLDVIVNFNRQLGKAAFKDV